MNERWRETYDDWKLATPPEHEGNEEAGDTYEPDPSDLYKRARDDAAYDAAHFIPLTDD